MPPTCLHPDLHPLRCNCCGLPFARVQNGALVIESHHHGQRHVNVISVAELRRLLAEPKQDDEAADNDR